MCNYFHQATLGAGALLERQVVFFCPKMGLLTTAVLAMIPLLRPFAWQSVVMPVLPAHDSMLHLLDAPVPFLLGMQVRLRQLLTSALCSQSLQACLCTMPLHRCSHYVGLWDGHGLQIEGSKILLPPAAS